MGRGEPKEPQGPQTDEDGRSIENGRQPQQSPGDDGTLARAANFAEKTSRAFRAAIVSQRSRLKKEESEA
ncbi:hypothetical protein [Rhodomicrobium lacus]|uniref:hypothetical protein n=1 Tax=Rhodomicrobium lacus TaxID=2498452 RepID=UPI000F8F04D4|nr:hypothetical protein [Rhodomicrobium lacus]